MNETARALEALLAESRTRSKDGRYVLHLYVAGMSPQSTRAIENVRAICERHLKGRVELTVIDVFQQPELAQEQQLIAAPTLLKTLPLPLRRLIGDLSNTSKVLLALDLPTDPEQP